MIVQYQVISMKWETKVPLMGDWLKTAIGSIAVVGSIVENRDFSNTASTWQFGCQIVKVGNGCCVLPPMLIWLLPLLLSFGFDDINSYPTNKMSCPLSYKRLVWWAMVVISHRSSRYQWKLANFIVNKSKIKTADRDLPLWDLLWASRLDANLWNSFLCSVKRHFCLSWFPKAKVLCKQVEWIIT